jgi:integrase
VVALNVGDIVADGEYTVMKLTIKGGQAHRVPAPPEALAAVNEYLAMSGHTKGAMFRRIKGGNSRLTRLSIYNLQHLYPGREAINNTSLQYALCQSHVRHRITGEWFATGARVNAGAKARLNAAA